MCCGCWERGGSHKIASAAVRAFWAKWDGEWEAHTVEAHAILDDDNVGDENISTAIAELKEVSPSKEALRDLAILRDLSALSHDERNAVVGLGNGCWSMTSDKP